MTDQNPTRSKRTGPKWLKNQSQPRDGETIGGGHFVFRRGKTSKRIKASWFPFEHGTLGEAVAQADKLAKKYPGETFIVVSQVTAARSEGGEA